MVATGQLIALLGTKLRFLGKPKATVIDNWAFRLHYRFTFLLFWVSCLIVTSTQFFGDPIQCIRSANYVDQRIINNYCWIEGTLTLPDSLHKVQGESVVMPGVEKYQSGDRVLTHKYYQWVCWVLFLQGIMFYIPRLFWKTWENGFISATIMDLNSCVLARSKRETNSKCLVDFLLSRQGKFDRYVLKYTLCEIFNLVNVWFQIFIINWFLGGQFLTYGFEVLSYNGAPEEIDPMMKVFPKMTKCLFRVYGSSGDVQVYDNYCLLPLNIINEKIYVILWFWLILLAVITTLSLIYRIMSFFSPPVRYTLLKLRARRRRHRLPARIFNTLMDNLSFGDWFFLSLLGKNLDPFHYQGILELFSRELEEPITDLDEPDSELIKGNNDIEVIS
ncbi:innexin inx2-like [Brevipalpus obovatus]|uniref:innexin inx2-like n=1 Tax=Brevipalpus obovatus TaxID=246614 RepID=UPI003D9EE534